MSLNQYALRVSLTVRKPQMTAKDDKATTDAERANNANGAGQYRKDLYPKHLVEGIQQVESAARAFIAKHTLDGVFPSSRFMWLADQLAPFEVQFNQAVTVFLNNWSNVQLEAQRTQGSLYDASLYPDMADLRSRFYWGVNYDTVADHTKFSRLVGAMAAPEAQRLTAAITAQVTQQQDAVVAEAMERLKKAVSHLGKTMALPTRAVINKRHGGVEVRPPIFKDSVVDNIKEMAEMLDAYSFALPPAAMALKDEAVKLAANNAEALRNDADLRAQTSQAAKALEQSIDEMFGYAPQTIIETITAPVVLDELADAQIPAEQQKAAMQLVIGDEFDIPVPQPEAKAPAIKEYTTGGIADALSELEDF